MNSEKITQIILGGLMSVAVIAIAWFFIQADKQAAVDNALASSGESSTSASGENGDVEQFSVDNAEDQFKTLSTDAVDEMLTSGRKQMLYIGCRYCPHCRAFEPIIKEFITKNNLDRDAVQKWEAGYRCYIEEGQDGYEQYERLASKLIDGGVPQFLYIENGEIVDSFSDDRTVENLEAFFKKHNYLLQ